jgi:hypothetical protein
LKIFNLKFKMLLVAAAPRYAILLQGYFVTPLFIMSSCKELPRRWALIPVLKKIPAE